MNVCLCVFITFIVCKIHGHRVFLYKVENIGLLWGAS